MKRAVIAGFAAGAAMAIGGALGAVSTLSDSRPTIDPNSEVSNPMIDGQAMLPDHDLMANLSASPQHHKLAAALRDSGIGSALKSNGLFTVFAPVDSAFTADGANKAQLAHSIGYLVVPGRYDSHALLQEIGQGGGQAKMRTLDGGVLTATLNGPTNILLMDERGRTADIAIYDVRSKNGVIMVIDKMAAPSGPPKQVALN